MALFIKKYGGTSVGTIERICRIADDIAKAYAAGNKLVIVLSAMGGGTDNLLDLAHAIDENPEPREYDALLATGEQVSVALMSIALRARNIPAVSYTGKQAGILTNALHKRATIQGINTDRLNADLENNHVPVVTGFQGVDSNDNITTLGRGGSDTTAVSLAAALQADECQIYTDVEGVYTADPRIISDARLLHYLTFEEMLELASLGAKVLQVRAVEFAGKYRVKLRVLPALLDDDSLLPDTCKVKTKTKAKTNLIVSGTLISYEDPTMEQPLVSGVAVDRNQSQLTLSNLPNEPGVGHKIFDPIAKAGIVVDMIVQNTLGDKHNTVDISFTVPRNEYNEAYALLKKVAAPFKETRITGNKKVAKLSIVGVGMRSNMGVASQLFGVLGTEGITILLVSTSEIKISVLIEEKYLELGARAVHAAYGLHEG